MTFYVASKPAGEGIDLISVAGELDLHTVPELDRWIEAALREGRSHIVIDMSEVAFIDSTAIGSLVQANRRTAEAEGSLRLVSKQKNVLRIMGYTGLSETLAIHETLDEAMAAVAGGD